MSYKRSRATYEDDRSYVVFGTPLPDESSTRDDGSYVPVWKQDVRDDRGRKRLHGAFTGGWSAGYFNTVGSKEGWTPSTFVSSRSDRQRHEPSSSGAAKQQQQQRRPEDYMDDEDLADAAEAQKVHTSDAFAGLGGRSAPGGGGLAGLLRAQGNDTMGFKLLRRMGWKDGQGIGPKVRRAARLDTGKATEGQETHLFAPDDVPMFQYARKTDRKGLGHAGESGLSRPSQDRDEEEDEDDGAGRPSFSLVAGPRKKANKPSRGIGVGILNDNGSDDEDPYEIGPKIRYNRVLGGDKKKKAKKAQKGAAAAVNPSLGSAPVFVPKTARAGGRLGRCHDGRLPPDGFVLARLTEDFAALLSQYAPPPVPEGWTSKKQLDTTDKAKYISMADAAKASTLDAKARAALLGETALPGKSVFDYISSSGRDKLATASGRTDLPQGLGEVPEEYRISPEEALRRLRDRVPLLDRETALAALARSTGLGGPYADDEDKRQRYRAYLDTQANEPDRCPPNKPPGVSDDEYVREMTEFYNCARIFKPMTGFMASRFTTAKSTTPQQQEQRAREPSPEKPADPAEEAARMGMFGRLTRSVADFYPSRLLCKRFNVRPPAHVQGEAGRQEASRGQEEAQPVSLKALPEPETRPEASEVKPEVEEVDPGRNDAVEATAAHEKVLAAIFGDDSDDD